MYGPLAAITTLSPGANVQIVHELFAQQVASAIALLRTALGRTHDGVTLRLADLPAGQMGDLDFVTGTITLGANLDDDELRTTLHHELMHLARGPVAPEDHGAEEAAVCRLTAADLLPANEILVDADHVWTPADISRTADHYGVDEDIVLDLIDPPTVRLYIGNVRAARRQRPSPSE